VSSPIVSALDIGLWDIAARRGAAADKLWGPSPTGFRYGSGGWSKYSERELIADREICGARLQALQDEDPPRRPRETEARRAVRRAVAMACADDVDVNQRWTSGNIRQAQALEESTRVVRGAGAPTNMHLIRAPRSRSRRDRQETTTRRFEFRELASAARRYSCPTFAAPTVFPRRCESAAMRRAPDRGSAARRARTVASRSSAQLSNGFLVEFIDWTHPTFSKRCEMLGGHFRIPERPGTGMALARGARENLVSKRLRSPGPRTRLSWVSPH